MTSSLPVCVGEHLTITPEGLLRLAPWSTMRNVVDVKIPSGADTPSLLKTDQLPGRLLMNKQVQYVNDTPIDLDIRILVTRRWRRWVTSNPNAVQFRDVWTWAVTPADAVEPVLPEVPVTTSLFNGQVGGAGDIGSNSVAEPEPGQFRFWYGTGTSEEWPTTLKPLETIRVWYRQYVWTPGPWSNNANKNAPRHEAEAGYSRLALWTFPLAGKLVTG